MKKIVLILTVLISTISTHGQVKMDDLRFTNQGDGRMYAEYREDDKPIDGKIRLITGYTTEYVDAEFSKGIATGKWEYYKENKLSEIMHYVDGYLTGEIIRYYNNGKTVKEQATMKNGKVNGTTKTFSPEGKLTYEKGLKDGVDEGWERRYRDNGELYSETFYKNGKKEGKSFSRTNLGMSDAYDAIEYYKDGKLHGDYLGTYADGSIRTKGKYVDGQKDGLWESFKKDGSRNGNSETFKNGKVIKRITYFTTGKPNMERNFNIDGKQHGIEKKYASDTGEVISELNFINGKKVGKQMRLVNSSQGNYIEYSNYNENGEKNGEFREVFVEKNKKERSKGQYVKDKKHGKWYYGNSLGFYKEETYDNGKLLETKSLVKD